MANWGYSVGNVVSRAAAAPVAVSPAAQDTKLLLSYLGSGYPDQFGALQWRSDATYAFDVDTNMLPRTSELDGAPNGCEDSLTRLAAGRHVGIGLSANPCDVGTYEGRTAYRLFRPESWDVDVMPGEDVLFEAGLRLAAGSTATGVRVRVVDLHTGDGWEGGSTDDWAPDGVAAEHAADSWLDVSVMVASVSTQRRTYRVILEPTLPPATDYGATTIIYVSDPALIPPVDLVAAISHNADIGLVATPSTGAPISVTAAQPSCWGLGTGPQWARSWRISISQIGGMSPRPVIGELWMGLYREILAGGPVTISLKEQSWGKSLEGARGRRQVIPDLAPETEELQLAFKARSAAHMEQIRDEIARLTRHGAEPLLLLPGARLDSAGRIYHGRIGESVDYSAMVPDGTGAAWAFGLTFSESPFGLMP